MKVNVNVEFEDKKKLQAINLSRRTHSLLKMLSCGAYFHFFSLSCNQNLTVKLEKSTRKAILKQFLHNDNDFDLLSG